MVIFDKTFESGILWMRVWKSLLVFCFHLNHDDVWISTKICLSFVLCVRVLIRVLCTRYSHVRRRVRIFSQKLNHLGHTNYKSASIDWFGGLFAVWGSICRLRIDKRGITPPPPQSGYAPAIKGCPQSGRLFHCIVIYLHLQMHTSVYCRRSYTKCI